MNGVLSLIQGDVFEIDLKVGEECALDVESIVFSSKEQKFTKEFRKISERDYFLEIPGSITKGFIPKVSSYDISVRFMDGEIMTAIYQNKLIVHRKDNSVEDE